MSRKRFTNYKPQKLTEFYFKPAEQVSEFKDGDGPCCGNHTRTSRMNPLRTHLTQVPLHCPLTPRRVTPLPSSPAKAKMRLETPPQRLLQAQIEAQAFNPLLSNQALYSSMASFPTSGQPVIDTTQKDMLLSLQTSLMTDLSSLFSKKSSDIHSLDDGVTCIEKGMNECTSTVNEVIEVYDDVREEQAWMQAKLADLEDRSCRNSVKLRGIPTTDLPCLAKEMMHIVIPEAPPWT